MTAIPRLLQSSKNQATRQLLQAGLRDRAPERAVSALTAALGLDIVAPLTPAQSAQHAGHASAQAAAAAGKVSLPAAGAALPSALTVAKVLLLGACAGGVVSTGYWLSQEPPSTASTPISAPVSAHQQTPTHRAPRTGAPSRASLAGPAGLSPNALRAPTPSASERARGQKYAPIAASAALTASATGAVERAPSASPNARLDGALERETRLVAGARQALSERDLARAATQLDSYDAEKVLGVLDREALLLRVELSLALGDKQGARSLAERFERSYPTDAHIPRLRARLTSAAKSSSASY